MGNLYFCGPLYDAENEEEIIACARGKLNNAPNRFQWALLNGISQVLGKTQLRIVNALPIGTWPRGSKRAVLRNRDWYFDKNMAKEIGCLNLPGFKQLDRYFRYRRFLRSHVMQGDSIIIYSCYLPILQAVQRMDPSIQVSLIVTDLPEYYDLGKSSAIRKMLRKINNFAVYRCMRRVDSFVLLSKQMTEPLRVGNRPFAIVEGIYHENHNEEALSNDEISCKAKIIFYSGTLHFRYGIMELIKAFEGIVDNDMELWICGSGEASDEIEQLARRNSRIKFFGFCTSERVAELRRHASVLVNPRPADGEYTKYSFPSKTMEYLASGIPTVAYKLPGIPDEYDYYINYAQPGNPGSLQRTLVDVCSDRNGQYSLKARNAREFILREKNAGVQAKKMLDMLQL